MRLLLLLLLVIVLATQLIVAFFVDPKNRQIDCVFAVFFDMFGAKNTVNTNVFGALQLEAQNHGICGVFLPLAAKRTQYLYTVFFARA